MFPLIDQSHLTLGLDSLVPDDRSGKALRRVTVPLGALLWLALLAWQALDLTGKV